jgi:hypothetical protein
MQSTTSSILRHPHAASRPNLAHRCLGACRRFLAQLSSIKAGVLREFRSKVEEHDHLLELAVNEAEALAWESGFPQLLFPALAMEKAQKVAAWHARQKFFTQRTGVLVRAAA